MPRLSNKHLRRRNNKGAHRRRRTTRGHRKISKFAKYQWYNGGTHNDYQNTNPIENSGRG